MTKEEINNALAILVQQELNATNQNSGKPLLEAYQLAVAKKQHELKEAFVADGGDPAEFKLERDEQDIRFDDLWAEWSKVKKAFREKVANEEKDNLNLKKELLEKINALKNEEHIKTAHETFKEIESKWKTIGRIPQDTIKEMDTAYSRARDEFFYNMHIYKELLENDLKKNLQLKEEVVAKMLAAKNLTSFKEMDATARRLTDEWNDIGPTYKEKWEDIRDQFWAAHHEVFDKIKEFFKGQKEKQTDNLQRKKELIHRLREINGHDIHSDKSWKKHTKAVIDLQKQWKTIGFAPKAENEKIWKEFKSIADDFFHRKSAFYANLKKEYDANKAIKEQLVADAESLIDNDDFRSTANALTALQKKWQQTGAAHHRDEQRLWKRFRAACNSFFEKKKTQKKQDSIDQKENLKAKNALIEEIKGLTAEGSPEESLKKVEKYILDFNKIGFVPLSDKQKVATDYKNALHKKLSEFGIPEEEMTEYLFNVKINELAGSKNPDRALEKEAQHIREKIRAVKSNILQYENNLGFFKNSKGANKLREEVEEKIRSNKEQLEKLEHKLEIIYSKYD